MKKIDSFINCYSIPKTLRFSLIPVGKTEENFNNALLLENDKVRVAEYQKVKKLIDRYHKHFIDKTLSNVFLDGIAEYSELYYRSGKTKKEMDAMEKLEDKMRKAIEKAFTADKDFKKLFGKEIIEEILPQFVDTEEERKSVETFFRFSTYFVGFHENRKNIYTSQPQSTAAAYRCINDNLPKFLDNAKSFLKIKEALPQEWCAELDSNCMASFGVYFSDIFSLDYFNFVLSQSGIDKYNGIIGGYTNTDGTKIKGLNEYINLYNQQYTGGDKSKRLPFVKALYKQILSDKESISFIPEAFEDDTSAIKAVKAYFDEELNNVLPKLEELFRAFKDFDAKNIFVRSGLHITELSNYVFGDWSVISRAWENEYVMLHPLKNQKKAEKYYEDLRKDYNETKSFSIDELQRLGSSLKSDESKGNIIEYYKEAVIEKVGIIYSGLREANKLLYTDYSSYSDKKLCQNDEAIGIIKSLLDAVKSLEATLKGLLGTGKEETKDENFYGEFLPLYESISTIDKLYDKVRNHVTKKPYSNDKIKLNFENPQLLGGWDKNKERDYRTVILRKDGLYYLAIMDKTNNKAFEATPCYDGGECYEKLEYKLLPGPNKMLPKVFFAESNVSFFNPCEEILKIRATESFKKGDNFNIDDCHKFIDFFKESINKHPDWSQFGFKFSDTGYYKDISEFYDEVRKQGYSISFRKVPDCYINSLVENGQLYLFKIYNKDFSEYSHGKPNLHTMYFKMLFDERNLADVVYQLNGGAEMFYREASIKKEDAVVHPANAPIDNKNPNNPKKQSTFEYDLIKDRRYTKCQFSLHMPITLNFKADGMSFINNEVRKVLKDADGTYVVGIDRGERNLLYVSVINPMGEIVEQKSLNIIGNVDYHALLERKEKERNDARQNWGTIENIKELKEGYLSLAVHEIVSLVLKYDAIIAMEDLNFGFKKGRFKVEKQVYQKFENMLITKLNYLINKNADATENGGLLRAYQLTNKVDGVNKGKQNGFIFYVPAYLTSKIDPVTGFADLLHPKYTSVKESLNFIECTDDIRYNKNEDIFEFDIDFDKFPKTNASLKKRWTICTNGDRIITYRNKEKNCSWNNKIIILTEEFKNLFSKNGIDYESGDIKEQILKISSKEFFESFMHLFSATLQMRNSMTGNVDVDYLISPVKDSNGNFYDSRNYVSGILPENADANGAYNIARKALWAISVLKYTPDDNLPKANLAITNADWFKYVQK